MILVLVNADDILPLLVCHDVVVGGNALLKEKILPSQPSIWTLTVAGSLKGFLKLSIEDVLLPTEVDIGCGSIIVGTSPLPSTLNSHLPTDGLSKIMFPCSITSRVVGEY